MSMAAVLVKVLPPLKNWSAPKLPVAAPPALRETVAWVWAWVGAGAMLSTMTSPARQSEMARLTNDRNEAFLMMISFLFQLYKRSGRLAQPC
jgi:hypothetical protein